MGGNHCCRNHLVTQGQYSSRLCTAKINETRANIKASCWTSLHVEHFLWWILPVKYIKLGHHQNAFRASPPLVSSTIWRYHWLVYKPRTCISGRWLPPTYRLNVNEVSVHLWVFRWAMPKIEFMLCCMRFLEFPEWIHNKMFNPDWNRISMQFYPNEGNSLQLTERTFF